MDESGDIDLDDVDGAEHDSEGDSEAEEIVEGFHARGSVADETAGQPIAVRFQRGSRDTLASR